MLSDRQNNQNKNVVFCKRTLILSPYTVDHEPDERGLVEGKGFVNARDHAFNLSPVLRVTE